MSSRYQLRGIFLFLALSLCLPSWETTRAGVGPLPQELGAAGSEKQLINLPLDYGYRLVITEIMETDLVLSLENPKGMNQKITVEHANITRELIEEVLLIKGEAKVYFLTAFDRSSTYGAQTSILLWKVNGGWRLTQAPFTRGMVEDPDGDGIFEIVETFPSRKVYSFNMGQFVAKEK